MTTTPEGEELAFVLLRPACVASGRTSTALGELKARNLAMVDMRLVRPSATLARAHLEAVGALAAATDAQRALAADLGRGPVLVSAWRGRGATAAAAETASEQVNVAESAAVAADLHALWFAAAATPPPSPSSSPPPPAPKPPRVAFGSQGNFYVTTAINYANGPPHMGHAYEGVIADVIARYHRAYGRNVFFLTGADEHGQKIADTATREGITPEELVQRCVDAFKALNAALHVQPDGYVRTSSEHHEAGASAVWRRSNEAGDVYLGKYTGWYNVREELFVTDADADAMEKDPDSGLPLDEVSGKPLERKDEESYFFRLSKYEARIAEHIRAHPEFVQPEVRRTEVLGRLNDGLKDLSISRTKFSWGIAVPDDEKHVMYVWFDALSNYLTAIGYPDGEAMAFWPASVHVIGKDITWFHCVIWPALLMSIGQPLPTTVLAHGFVHGADGRKMSKSIGNVVDALDVLSRFSVDSFRFFVVRDSPCGGDLTFSEDALALRHNGELLSTFGNLVNRSLNLCVKYCEGRVPLACAQSVAGVDVCALRDATERAYASWQLHSAMELVFSALNAVNKYVTDAEPWHLKEGDPRRSVVVRTLLEYVYALCHFLQPVLVQAAPKVFEKLGTPPVPIAALSGGVDNLTPGTPTMVGEVLYEKAETAEALMAMEEKAEAAKAAKKRAAEKAARAAAGGGEQSDLSKVELRVGRVLTVEAHPDKEVSALYVEQIDLGESEGARTVVSGLRKYMPDPAALKGQLVVCVANMKASKMKGVESKAMLLCAFATDPATGGPSFDGPVALVQPPEGAAIGERITFEGHTDEPERQLNPKKKVWERVKPTLKTDGEGVARAQGLAFTTCAGPCRAIVTGGAIQ